MVREERLLTPAEAVHRLTGQPAERLGLTRPRRAARRARAPTSSSSTRRAFAERGTTYEPNQLAAGVAHVVVNGVPTLRDGQLTGDRAGMVLRR